jgi:hypothetical protein
LCDPKIKNGRYLDFGASMTTLERSSRGKTSAARSDGRKTLLVYMNADLIKNLKKAALDDEKNVYEIVEEAARDWLSKTAGKRGAHTSASETSPRKKLTTTRSAK